MNISRAVLLVALILLTTSVRAQTLEVAITIDDLPLNGPQFDPQRLRAMTGTILAAIKKHQIPAVGFVNESLLYRSGETDARIEILKQWIEGGVELGNHTFSHLGFGNASLADYQDDFIRGDAVTRRLMSSRKPRYFRHPFLQMGKTAADEIAFESFLGTRGYVAVPVSVDVLDWMINAAYAKARAQGDAEALRKVGEEYVKFAERRFEHAEQSAMKLFGRPAKQIVLLHANELTSENLDALATMLKARGYRFITVEQALQDPLYQMPEKYVANSDRMNHWSVSKGIEFTPPMPPEFLQQAYKEAQRARR